VALDLSDLSPAPGELDPDPETARFTPITAVLEVESGFVPMVFAKIGTAPHTWHVVFDGVASAFSPLFDEHSTIQSVGDVHTFSVLPTGGWWASPAVFTFGQFEEAL
jgi:hypothetical protein